MKLEKKMTIYILMLVLIVIGSMQFIFFKNASNILVSNRKNSLIGYSFLISREDKIIKDLAKKDYKDLTQLFESKWPKLLNLNSLTITDNEGNLLIYKSKDSSSTLDFKQREELKIALKNIQSEPFEYYTLDPKTNFLQVFVPILYQGKQLGMLGIEEYYNKNENLRNILFMELFIGTIIILIITFLLSIFLARNIKSQLFGYEPDEIAKFYSERQLIFDTISDEIITLDSTGKITKMNKIAKKNLQKSDEIILKKIHNEIILSKTMISNREYRLSSGIVYISTLLISNTNDKFNILFIIKSGAKVKQLAKDITGVTQIINSMRATVHEFKNKIHVISGLLRLEEYEEAKKYVSSLKLEVDHENNEVENINDTTIKALLLTKINLAKEKQITLKVEEESNLMSNHKNIDSDDLIVIIGNLIENAIESFSHKKEGKKEIKTYFLEDSNKIYIEVSDNGDPITNIENIFKVGVSSKGEGRGSGLALIKNIVSIYNGTINIKVENNFKTFSIELIKEVL